MAKFIYKLTENEEELQGANEVRRQVFVIEQGIAEELTFEKSVDGDEINIVVKDQDTIIGTARAVFLSDDTAKIERMAILKNYRKRGLGKGIILFLNEEFKRRKISHTILHAQYQVIDFYKACGFHESGQPFQEAGIKHVKMEMQY
jgi:predicted GNAT family N-acyltransferase